MPFFSADKTTEAGLAILKLRSLMDVINQCVGDALSDLLLVEAILYARGWSIEQWDQQYTDLPNKLLKVSVSYHTGVS